MSNAHAMPTSLHTLPHVHQGPLLRQSQALQQHMQQCRLGRGRGFQARVWAERIHDQLASRPVTLMVAAAALMLVLGSGW